MTITLPIKVKYKARGKFLFFSILIFCITLNTVKGQSYPYKFNYLTVDEGLSHTDANDITQDEKGYIWIATYFGLDRYDGYAINKYYNNNVPIDNALKNRLRCLYPDDKGNIWLGSEGGLQCFDTRLEKYVDFTENKNASPVFEKLYKPKGDFLYGLNANQIKCYLIQGSAIVEQKLSTPPGVEFWDMVPDYKGTLYLSGNKGLWKLDQHNQLKEVTILGLPDLRYTKVYIDHRNNLILASGSKLFLTGSNSVQLTSANHLMVIKQVETPDKKDVKNVIEDKKSGFWINEGPNLLRLDAKLNLIQTLNKKNSLHGLNSESITKIFIDRSECLWACTYASGINYCDLNEKLFFTFQHNPEVSNSLAGNHIRSILADGENLWIGTMANGLNLYNINTQIFKYFNSYSSALKLKNNAITSLTFDNAHNLWIGSESGIEILKPGLIELWRPPGYKLFPNYSIETLVKDCYGNIWFGNHMNRFGVIWKDKSNNFKVKYYGEGYFILADKHRPQLFISSTHGLKRVIIDAQGNITQTFNYLASSKPNSLSSNYTYPVCKKNDSTYWIGTIGGGLNQLLLKADKTYQIKVYAGNYGVFNDVESLEIDDSGKIWIGGNGLECLNPVTGKLIRYDKNDGLQGNSFKVGASYKASDGKLYFGGINGLNYFYPDQIKSNTIAARPILTDILINNQRPHLGKSDSSTNTINQAISYCKQLTINYLQDNFVIFFSAMHFANPLKCKYRYKLIGFDKDWKYTDGKNPSAAYSNLQYTDYNFIVEATNNDGIWSSSNAEMTISITPPWWKSTTAKIIYTLLFLSGLSGIYIYQARWYRLKREIEVSAINEKKREEMHKQREELYQQQLMFFTNISHEFRTPLTLILGPLENLISQNTNIGLENSYQLMLRNAKRLMNLISELMNFKKVADSIIKLHVQPLVVNQFCKDLALEFQNLANRKNIEFKLINRTDLNETEELKGVFDIQVLEKILFNLLNNSFKYTDVNGQVTFEIFFDLSSFKPTYESGFQLLNDHYRAEKYIYFRVADSGIGISAESITRIFDRYYRINKNHLGSGVGLALVKSLTQLHKGDIYVYSERYKGTEIIIGIPWGTENYADTEKAAKGSELESELEAIDNSILYPLHVQENNIQPVSSKINKHILIVEDNQELRVFLKQVFEKHYYVSEAEDGNKGMEIATEKVPDLIISDVMMPGINGIEFCKLIKEKFETRHIPFIILSAKDALDTKIEGMESGADFYFSKPLSIEILLLTVHNIFEQREALKLRYTNNYLSEATELVHSQKDKEFFNKLIKLIEENIQEPDLDVDFLCKHLYISRTKLYQKIKSISGQSVGDFIRTIRLKRSIHFMTHEDIAMNEVAERVGLQSSSNFSRAFKKEYGKSPMQFLQALKKS